MFIVYTFNSVGPKANSMSTIRMIIKRSTSQNIDTGTRGSCNLCNELSITKLMHSFETVETKLKSVMETNRYPMFVRKTKTVLHHSHLIKNVTNR